MIFGIIDINEKRAKRAAERAEREELEKEKRILQRLYEEYADADWIQDGDLYINTVAGSGIAFDTTNKKIAFYGHEKWTITNFKDLVSAKIAVLERTEEIRMSISGGGGGGSGLLGDIKRTAPVTGGGGGIHL